ncbi:MAG: hypothetical protein ACYC09_15250 [Bacteroidota bacterium]
MSSALANGTMGPSQSIPHTNSQESVSACMAERLSMVGVCGRPAAHAAVTQRLPGGPLGFRGTQVYPVVQPRQSGDGGFGTAYSSGAHITMPVGSVHFSGLLATAT